MEQSGISNVALIRAVNYNKKYLLEMEAVVDLRETIILRA